MRNVFLQYGVEHHMVMAEPEILIRADTFNQEWRKAKARKEVFKRIRKVGKKKLIAMYLAARKNGDKVIAAVARDDVMKRFLNNGFLKPTKKRRAKIV